MNHGAPGRPDPLPDGHVARPSPGTAGTMGFLERQGARYTCTRVPATNIPGDRVRAWLDRGPPPGHIRNETDPRPTSTPLARRPLRPRPNATLRRLPPPPCSA